MTETLNESNLDIYLSGVVFRIILHARLFQTWQAFWNPKSQDTTQNVLLERLTKVDHNKNKASICSTALVFQNIPLWSC